MAQDIRYTRSKGGRTLYAIAMGWPEKNLALRFVQVDRVGSDAKVTLLGHDKPLRFEDDNNKHLTIQVPALSVNERSGCHAHAFEISGFETALSPEARLSLPGVVTLKTEKAVLEGQKINTEDRAGSVNIGFWDDPAERGHWLLHAAEAGVYHLMLEPTDRNNWHAVNVWNIKLAPQS